jgi:hypothetical protein
MIFLEGDFVGIYNELHHKLLDRSDPVETHWQAMTDVPMNNTMELRNVSIETLIPRNTYGTQIIVSPNLPWSEDHFQERVGGEPTNPGDQYYRWPFWRGGHRDDNALFSHTYQERMWPKFAAVGDTRPNGRQVFVPHNGIRYEFGDLNDVVELLRREPYTRQAWLPIWFPEDTGAHHGGRVPCSIGYHFLLRAGELHVTYMIRSVDFLRHFRDDVYMAMRLGQWVLDGLTNAEPWEGAAMGRLTMHMGSLHVFQGDVPNMNRNKPPRP